ncbi:hypothetical protein J5N97_016007 [Dioscorea zingiberensis]|uniref:Uncharacterized protein n=1 Tax=Dioscorea zingiberensis TaxID=325984 RepID=A0A9D5HF92_9LILI|nr:hypothetical protein J5N97_016007 [Dioscorea zingiberensis]
MKNKKWSSSCEPPPPPSKTDEEWCGISSNEEVDALRRAKSLRLERDASAVRQLSARDCASLLLFGSSCAFLGLTSSWRYCKVCNGSDQALLSSGNDFYVRAVLMVQDFEVHAERTTTRLSSLQWAWWLLDPFKSSH